MFDGILDKCTGSDYTIELLENTMPYYTITFPIPTIYKSILEKQDDR